jgi:hypothetical protein
MSLSLDDLQHFHVNVSLSLRFWSLLLKFYIAKLVMVCDVQKRAMYFVEVLSIL